MRNRRERTLLDLCDVTPTLSQPQITPVLRGNFMMQGPNDETNRDLLTNMATSVNSSHCSARSQKVDYRGNSGACNVCSAPCSSCFHVNKVLLKSNNESVGETYAGNTETGQLSILSAVGGMGSTSDSFFENAAGKASSRASNASDDSVVHSKRDGWKSPEGHDDCMSCVSGTDEQVNRKSDTEDSGNKSNKENKMSRDMSGKVSPSSSQTEVSFTKSTDDTADVQKVQNTSQSSNVKNLIHEESPTSVNDDKPSNTKVELLKASTEHFNSSPPNGVASDNVCDDPPKMDRDSVEKNDEMEIETLPVDESDDSDMVEQDVKVCDICGDAGREDLLAVCSRCSDGAEHTYCMREMLEKLPEGEWFCEECKMLEMVGNGKPEKIRSVDENEKNNSSGRASENLNHSDFEGQRTKISSKNPSKRLRDDEDAEVSSVAKKPAFESTVGSPKTSNSKLAALSRESSLKHLDKGRLKSPNRSTLDTAPANDVTELAKPSSDARGLNSRGTFAKSNSFSSLNLKPKVKLVDQVIIQRQKSVKEHGSHRLKDGLVRSIGKSMSFRSTTNSNRSESKTKMLSPRSSHIQDVKSTKERSAFERQRSFKTEHPSNNSMMGTSVNSTSRIDKRPSSKVESSSLTTPSNPHEVKHVQTDTKSAALSRSSSLAARRTADLPSSTGDFKRPSKHGHSTSVLSSANGVNNTEQKYNQTSLKQDPAACPSVSEKLPVNASEGLFDGSVQAKDITDSADQSREYSGSRFRPPSVRSSRDESDNLKAAIEAAVLRKPGVYRKHRSFSQPDVTSVPTVAPVASHTDHLSSVRNRKLSSDAELAERPALSRNLTADPPKEETSSSLKQSLLVPAEGLSSGGREGVHIDLSSRDTFSNVPTAIPLLLKSVAIPEHEYIWQGSFEICRSGQTFELWDGIQAHLSTCASPKVIEAVNKFKNRLVLYEVPRASTWPVQFQENCVREDNIALFFFAKDLQSHDKVYKILLENMMKNDLALKGNINGVELLIFPSNQLPVNLQRWNTLFFLWGVFRGKKESSTRHMPDSVIAPRDIPPPIMSLPDNRCSPRTITENASQDVHPGLQVPASEELQGLPGVIKRDCDASISPLGQLGHGQNSNLSSAARSNGGKLSGEVTGAIQEGGISSSSGLPVAMASTGTGREQRLIQPDVPLGNPNLPHDSSELVAGKPKEGTGEGLQLEKSHQNQLKSRVDAIDLTKDEEIPLEDDIGIRDLNVEPNKWLFNHKEPNFPEPSSLGHRSLGAGTSQVLPRNDVDHETCRTYEKVNRVATVSYAPHSEEGEAAVGSIKYYEHAERHFFPVQAQPVQGLPLPDGSMPWKTHVVDEDGFNDKAPNLELALGAERAPLTLGMEPLLISKVEENDIVGEASKKGEDDVSASLSLSLSFPFPEKEVEAKPSPKTEKLMSQRRHHVKTSGILSANTLVNTQLLPIRSNTHSPINRSFSVRAHYHDSRDGTGADFVAGFVIGGAVFGTLAYIFAPQIRRSVLNEDEYGFRKAKRPIYYDEGLEENRESLNEKIIQLNKAMDNVSSRLRGRNNLPHQAEEAEAYLL